MCKEKGKEEMKKREEMDKMLDEVKKERRRK